MCVCVCERMDAYILCMVEGFVWHGAQCGVHRHAKKRIAMNDSGDGERILQVW